MTDKNKIADILLDFYDEYRSNEINRPMIPSIYAGKIINSLQGEPSKFDAAIQEGDDVRYNEDLGCRVNLSQLKRVAKKEEPVSKNYRERYKRIAQSEKFKKTYEGMSVGEIMHVEGEEPVSEDLENEIDIYLATRKWREVNETFSADRLVSFANHFVNWQKKKYDIIGKDLEEAAENYAQEAYSHPVDREVGKADFILGAKWQKENLWKSADGDDLPDIDREVIAILDTGKVVFAHRPNPNGWDAKSIITEKVERYIPETYDKGCWNIPNVKYWLDEDLPKEIEL